MIFFAYALSTTWKKAQDEGFGSYVSSDSDGLLLYYSGGSIEPKCYGFKKSARGTAPLTNGSSTIKVCFYWKAGRCTRHPCPFLHGVPQHPNVGSMRKRSVGPDHLVPPVEKSHQGTGRVWRNPSAGPQPSAPSPKRVCMMKCPAVAVDGSVPTPKVVCNRNVEVNGKACTVATRKELPGQTFLCISDSFSLLACLGGHSKAVTGITMVSGYGKLFSGSNDKTVKIWDCWTGQCVQVVTMEGEVGCIISEGQWVLVGVPNAVKAWNLQASIDVTLEGPKGQVYALIVGNNTLFAGTEDGSIWAWKPNPDKCCFEPAAALRGHKKAVVSFIVGAHRLYSGSMDCTIRVWDLATLQCTHTLTGHESVVMSLLCWDQFLFSCSLDGTVKVWAATGKNGIEVEYTHKEEHGVLVLHGVNDAKASPVLMCSCNDNVVRVYDLPSFNERGRIFSKEEVRILEIGPGGLFFTGDGAGELKVWKLYSN
uniref:C3H1-type domain-containing protein n=1 Tax=Ananas comosus var. bracteatus TaxID=296719 RepID=A0A6V7PHB6_ANACO|nr:unnamed protein product [Ananas comosus var. bracteatus]